MIHNAPIIRVTRYALSVACCLLACVAVAADPPVEATGEKQPPASNSSADSLDAQLLEGLDDELMSDLEDLDLGDDKPAKGSRLGRGPLDEGDRELIEQLGRGAGEDVGTEGEADPLSRIGERMREVEQLIRRADVGEPTRELQDEIVSELETLIREARRRQNSSSSSGDSQQQQTKERKQVKQPQQPGAKGSGSGDPNSQPAQDSTDRVEQDRVRDVDMQDMQELMRQVWGHLPQRDREQMLQSTVDVFLPKYSTMIEEYFRRLAEIPEGRRER